MTVIYRIADINDAAAIAHLHAESWRNTYRGLMNDSYLDGDIYTERLNYWQARFANPTDNQFALVAIKDDELAGFACVYGAFDAEWGSLIDNLHVRPDLKGQGIGKQLIHKAINWARENYPQIGVYLWVYEANLPSRRFYEAMGGVNVGKELHNNEGGQQACALRYVW